MPPGTIFLIVSILALVVIVAFIFLIERNPERKRLSPLTGIAFAFIIASMLFQDNRLIGYSLLGVGVVIAVVDILLKMRRGQD